MANSNRTPRDLEIRERQESTKQWRPADKLPEPHEVEGFGHRWIRKSVMGQGDPTNVSRSMREGWEPCILSEYPELELAVDPGASSSQMVEVGGLILCKMPKEMIAQRDAYYRNAAQAQVEAVDSSFMKENDARMPLFSEKKSATSFGRGSR